MRPNGASRTCSPPGPSNTSRSLWTFTASWPSWTRPWPSPWELEPLDETTLKAATILVVDDEEANVILLERLLQQDGYSRILTTTDSSTAVALCAGQPPDIVLLDL